MSYTARQAELIEKEIIIVSREEWGAAPCKEEDSVKVEHPAKFVVFSTTRTDSCTNKEECMKIVKEIQEDHMRQGLPDIMHNFLVGGDGAIYEGRGWNIQAMEFDKDDDMDKKTIDIAFIGRYKEPGLPPTEEMLRAAYWFIFLAISKNLIQKKYKNSQLDYI